MRWFLKQNTVNKRDPQRNRKSLHSERGSMAIEFGLLLPILALILFGVVDFGRMLWFKEVLVNATRDGARTSALFSSAHTEATIQTQIGTLLTQGGLSSTGLGVTTYLNGAANPNAPNVGVSNDLVQVQSILPWNYLIIDKLLPATLTTTSLQANITMLHE